MLADLQKLVLSLVRDETTRLASDDLDTAIKLALQRYSQDRPRSKVEDVISAGGDTLPLPLAWVTDSELLGTEYPIGETPPAALGCTIYTQPTGDVLMLGAALSIGAIVRLTFTVPHEVTASVNTVSPAYEEAVACWAAALLLEQLAAGAINDSDSTISADTTDRRTKAQEYASRANALKKRYTEALGIGAGGNATGGGQVAAGTTVSWPGRSRLTNRIYRNG